MIIKNIIKNIELDSLLCFSLLKNSFNIVIKNADESNTIVIMDRNQNISEAERHLVSKHYMQVQNPDLQHLHNLIQNIHR